MDWFGRAKTTFTHHASPLAFKERDGSQTDLLRVCEKVTPPCQLNPLLFNGHLQTMWTAVADQAPQIFYKRRIFDADHKTYTGTFAVDYAVPAHSETDDSLPPRTAYFSEDEFAQIGSDDARPMLIVLHGLSGGSYEIYLRHAIAPLLLGNDDWEVCVVNSRGCANSKITSGVLFNARATWDVRQFVKWAKEKYPNRPLFGLGFSLGGCILTNFVAEEGADCLLKAAVVVGNPFNLDVSSKALQRTLVGKQVYQRVMGSSMRKLANLHRESLEKYTNVDYEQVQKITYLFEFDREIQTKTWGYPTEEAYYRDASSADSVNAIRIPFFAITAADDPIAVVECIPYEEFRRNPYTVLLTTSLGGHLAFFEIGGGRWHARPVSNFLKYMAENIDLDSIDQERNRSPMKTQFSANFNPMRRKMEIILD